MIARNLSALVLVSLSVVACASRSVAPVPTGEDTYLIAQSTVGGPLKSRESLKSGVIERANAFAQSKGKVAVPIASRELPGRPGTMPSFEYEFRLVGKVEPGAPVAPVAAPAPVAALEAQVSPAGQDYYSELIKLDDLRKKGIISQAEFEALKQKVLGRQ